MNQADLDNHANQLNPDQEEYWHCREQPELPNNYQSDSEDDESFCSSQINYVAPKSPTRPKYHIIDPKTVRWGVEYDENTRCGTTGYGWPKDKPFVLPMDIDELNGHYVDSSFPEEWLEDPAARIQKWWQHVKRYREKQKAYACMTKAVKMRAVIDKNQKRISELNKELRKLYVEDAKLQEECHKTFCGACGYYKLMCNDESFQCARPDTKGIIKTLTELENGEEAAFWYKTRVDRLASWSAEFTNRWLKRDSYASYN